MPVQEVVALGTQINFEFPQRNDPLVTFRCQIDGADINLDSRTIELYIKTSASIDDTDASVKKYSTAADGNVEITAQSPQSDATKKGRADVQFAAADLPAAGTRAWYHLDVITNSKRVTHAFGWISTIDM